MFRPRSSFLLLKELVQLIHRPSVRLTRDGEPETEGDVVQRGDVGRLVVDAAVDAREGRDDDCDVSRSAVA